MAARSPEADQYRLYQAQLAATLTRDLVLLLRALFNPMDPGPAWQAVRTAVAALIADRRRQSADAAVAFYWAQRLAAGVRSPFTPAAAAALPVEQILASVDATGIAAFARAARAGATPQQALDRSAVTLSGSASRLVLGGGRAAVDASVRSDDAAIGWARVTDADPCSWCAVMACGAPSTLDAQTAGRAKNAQFIGGSDFAWHDHCGVPSRARLGPRRPGVGTRGRAVRPVGPGDRRHLGQGRDQRLAPPLDQQGRLDGPENARFRSAPTSLAPWRRPAQPQTTPRPARGYRGPPGAALSHVRRDRAGHGRHHPGCWTA